MLSCYLYSMDKPSAILRSVLNPACDYAILKINVVCRRYVSTFRDYEPETTREKAIRKFGGNPFIPLGSAL